MSGLARYLIESGCRVTGSDIVLSDVTERLSQLGAVVYHGHHPKHILPNTNRVVYTVAISNNNPELIAARNLGIEVLKYSELLGLLMKEKIGVAVAGTHGKTTTTAMIAYILEKAGFDPTYVIGGFVPILGGSSKVGRGDHFIAEACEYDRSFHNLYPHVAVITNIEEDHLDYYKDIYEIVVAFRTFARLIPSSGMLVGNVDDERVATILRQTSTHTETFSLKKEEATWNITDLTYQTGRARFSLVCRGRTLGTVSLLIPGMHNVQNALAAAAVTSWLGVQPDVLCRALSSFPGVARRLQVLGALNDVIVIDDYAHHPTEIRTVLTAASQAYPMRRLWCVFQPHQHSRTRILLNNFASAFKLADKVIVPDIYFVRDSEAERRAITAFDLVKKIQETGKEAYYLPTFDDILSFLRENLKPGDVLITMGAGTIGDVAKRFLSGT